MGGEDTDHAPAHLTRHGGLFLFPDPNQPFQAHGSFPTHFNAAGVADGMGSPDTLWSIGCTGSDLRSFF